MQSHPTLHPPTSFRPVHPRAPPQQTARPVPPRGDPHVGLRPGSLVGPQGGKALDPVRLAQAGQDPFGYGREEAMSESEWEVTGMILHRKRWMCRKGWDQISRDRAAPGAKQGVIHTGCQPSLFLVDALKTRGFNLAEVVKRSRASRSASRRPSSARSAAIAPAQLTIDSDSTDDMIIIERDESLHQNASSQFEAMTFSSSHEPFNRISSARSQPRAGQPKKRFFARRNIPTKVTPPQRLNKNGERMSRRGR